MGDSEQVLYRAISLLLVIILALTYEIYTKIDWKKNHIISKIIRKNKFKYPKYLQILFGEWAEERISNF